MLLDLQTVGLLELSNLSVCARVQYAEARRKLRPKSKCVCVFITAVPIIKLLTWEEGDSGGHVLRESTS